MNAVCVVVAGLTAAVLPGEGFDLVWRHTVEKIFWRETWRLSEDRLVLAEAAVKGSGAGMEPPPGAVLVEGEWRYQPAVAPLGELVLARSRPGGDWWLCDRAACRTLESLVPTEIEGPAVLRACSP